MSQFLSEPAAADPSLPTPAPATLDVASGDTALMQKVLSTAARNPNLIPPDFMAYLVDYMQTTRLQVPIGQVPGAKHITAVTGIIPAAGATATAGNGFTYTHTNGSGIYAVTFGTSFAVAPLVFVARTDNASSAGGGWQFSVPPTTAGFTIKFGAGGVDEPWEFMALAVN